MEASRLEETCPFRPTKDRTVRLWTLMKEKEYQYKKLSSELIFLIGRGTQMKSLLLPGELKKDMTGMTRLGGSIS